MIDGYLNDLDPQSGGSKGVIYDLDAPGIRKQLAGDDAVAPVGAIFKHRANFQQWALFGNERCSEKMPWFVRLARRRITVEGLKPYESIGGAEENFGRRGVTGLGYDPSTNPSMMVNLVAQPTYKYIELPTRATASVVGEFTPGVEFKWIFDEDERPPVLVQGDNNSQDYVFKVRPKVGRHTIFVKATDSSGPALVDATSVDVFTNREPTAVIEYARLSPDRELIEFKGSGDDAEKLLPPGENHTWHIRYLDQTGAPVVEDGGVIDDFGPFGLGREVSRPLPVGTARVLVSLTVVDDGFAEAHALTVVEVPED